MEQEFLQAMYKEQCDQARQHEAMRQQATAVAMTLAGAVVSFAAASGGVLGFVKGSGDSLAIHPLILGLYSLLGVFVIGIARHGRALSLKHYERNRLHVTRASIYRHGLEALFPGRGYEKIPDKADEVHKGGPEVKRSWQKQTGARGAGAIEQDLYILWIELFRFLNWVGWFMVIVPLIVAAALT